MVDCFELLFFHTKMYVLLETGGMILAYLGTLLGLLGRILAPFGGLSGTTLALFSQSWGPFWAFLANVGTISIVATPKRPLWKTPKLGRTLGGNRKLERTLGRGHEPQTLVHLYMVSPP